MGALSVHHFGPDPATVGGMASVIRVLTQHEVGGDVVEAHPTWRPGSRAATARLSVTATKVLWHLPKRHVAHIHISERGSFLREGMLVALARQRGLATIATIHGASFLPFAAQHPQLVSEVLRRAHVVTCLDETVLGIVQRSAPNVMAEIVPNAVEIDTNFTPADRTEEIVLFAGEIGLRKGADVLLRAWPLIATQRPSARCLMVGPITDFTPPSSERVAVRPAVGPAEMKDLVRRARVVALPARAEGMPMILTEAMSMGRPFVSTPVGGIPDLAEAGGLLVSVDDEISLADRLTELLIDPTLASRIGEQGRELCARTRSIEVLDRRWRGLYTAAVGYLE
jgi:glycosyltransferase involved in cell wall biosynthesis